MSYQHMFGNIISSLLLPIAHHSAPISIILLRYIPTEAGIRGVPDAGFANILLNLLSQCFRHIRLVEQPHTGWLYTDESD